MTGISGESATLERSLFVDGTTYRWTVAATDGYSVRGTQYAEFVFGPATATEPSPELPSAISTLSVYPNPFGSVLSIEAKFIRAEHVLVEIFDASGRRIAELFRGVAPPGIKRVDWDPGSGIASASYIVKITVGEQTVTRLISRQ